MTPMPDAEAALWAAEGVIGVASGPVPEIPDPFPVAALLRAAVEHARADGRSASAVARDAGLLPPALFRALREDRETQPETIRAILRACGMRLVVVPAETRKTPRAHG